MFSERTRKAALEVMDRVMAHPISNLFKEPIAKGEEPERYYDVVKNPQYLNPIRQKLENGQYKQIKDWMDDVELVWSNVELFYGGKSSWGFAAAENRRLFAKEKSLFEQTMIGSWCREVYGLRTLVTELMTQPPEKVRQFADKLGAVRTMKHSQPLLSEKELQSFMQAAEMLTSDEDHREIIRIVTEMQPELENGRQEIFVDVTKLKPSTVQAVTEYMKSALEKQGLKYPE